MTTIHEPTADVFVPGWYPDPTERHPERYFDGWGWTARVKSGDVETKDTLPEDLSGFLAKPHGPPLSVEAIQPSPPSAPMPPLAPLTEPAAPKRRLRLIIGVVVVIAIGIGVAVGLSAGGGGSSASSAPATQSQTPQQAGSGYFDSTTLANKFLEIKNSQLTNSSVTATSANCIAAEGRHFTCQVAFDDGSNLNYDVLVAADGQSYVSGSGS